MRLVWVLCLLGCGSGSDAVRIGLKTARAICALIPAEAPTSGSAPEAVVLHQRSGAVEPAR